MVPHHLIIALTITTLIMIINYLLIIILISFNFFLNPINPFCSYDRVFNLLLYVSRTPIIVIVISFVIRSLMMCVMPYCYSETVMPLLILVYVVIVVVEVVYYPILYDL